MIRAQGHWHTIELPPEVFHTILTPRSATYGRSLRSSVPAVWRGVREPVDIGVNHNATAFAKARLKRCAAAEEQIGEMAMGGLQLDS